MKKIYQISGLLLFICAFQNILFASGLETNGISPRGRSMGFAMVAAADDWSAIHYNPAAAAMIDGSVFGFEYEFFTGGMSSSKSLRNLNTGGDPARSDFYDPFGDEPSSFGENVVSSDIHFGALGYVSSLEKISWGIGLYGSGSGTAWNDRIQTGGGDTVFAEIAYTNGSANVPVVIAWKVRPELSLGVTLGIHWGLLTVENTKIRTGALPYVMDTTQDTDGIAIGLDFGCLWKPREDLRFGAVIRLPYTFRKTGDTRLEQSLAFVDYKTATTVDMKYPLRVTLGGALNVTDRDLFAASVTWLDWSSYTMKIDYNNEIPFMLEDYSGNPSHWEDTIRLHAGYERILNEQWAFRCGLTYDQAPEPMSYRTLTGGQVLDAWLFTAGAGVDLGDMDLEFGTVITYSPPVSGYVPGAEYRMTTYELFIGMVWQF